MRLKLLLVAAPCAAVIAAAGAAPASAGEFNANGQRTGAATKALSICSTSGLNLDDPGGRTQSFGEGAAGGGARFFNPGDPCNAHKNPFDGVAVP